MIRQYLINVDKVELTLIRKNEEGLDLFDTILPKESDVDLFEINQQDYKENYRLKEFTLILDRNGISRMYNFCYSVYYGLEEVAKLYLDNRTSKEYINLKINNELLYNETQYFEVVNKFISVFNVQINNFSSFDIAIDCRKNLIKLFDKYYENEAKYHFVSKSIRGDNPDGDVSEFSKKKRNGTKNSTYYIGKINVTGKQVCIYNKTIELQSSYKPYIEEAHEQLSGTSDVYRLELRLRNNYIKRHYVIEHDKIFDVDYLKEIMNQNLDNFIDFRMKHKQYKPAQCKKIYLFDLSAKNKKCQLLKPVKKEKKATSINVAKLQKRSLKDSIQLAILNDSHDELIDCMKKAEKYNLVEYYRELTNGINLTKIKKDVKPYTTKGFDFDNLF